MIHNHLKLIKLMRMVLMVMIGIMSDVRTPIIHIEIGRWSHHYHNRVTFLCYVLSIRVHFIVCVSILTHSFVHWIFVTSEEVFLCVSLSSFFFTPFTSDELNLQITRKFPSCLTPSTNIMMPSGKISSKSLLPMYCDLWLPRLERFSPIY
jgi:hypothetical protein